MDAARRELREETGIARHAQALRYLGEIVDDGVYAEDHAHVFELRCDEEPRGASIDARWSGPSS